MDRLPRTLTAAYFTGPAAYADLRAWWKEQPRRSFAEHVLYLALIGRDYRRAYTPVTNAVKLANGRAEGDSLILAIQVLRRPCGQFEPIRELVERGIVTEASLKLLLSRLPRTYSEARESAYTGVESLSAERVPELAGV